MNGFINVNKRVGSSSTREVNVIKTITRTPCGHMGTLDPMASGVLPVAIGNSARLFDYFLQKKKTYVATFRFGVDSDTLDVTGEMQENCGRIPTADEIKSIIPMLCGEIDQIPPKYSAKNVQGKRGYELARAGVEFDLPPKKVIIDNISLLGETDEGDFRFEIECGGGTYIRSIARDMANMLSTKAVMSSLIRTKSGPFTLENAVETQLINRENVQDFIIPTENVLPFDSIYPKGNDAKRLFNGLYIDTDLKDGTYKIFDVNEVFYGLAIVQNSKLKIRTKLC